jgi:tetratricopeptide (TPR) repeat protein
MVSGQRAFKRETALQTMVSIVESDPRPLAEIAPDVPAEVQTIVSRCLSKDPAGRYASTRDLARDLHDLQLALVSGSRSISHLSSVRPRVRRSPVRWAIAAGLLAATVAVVAWLALSSNVLEQSRALLNRYDLVDNVDLAISQLADFVDGHPQDAASQALLAEAYWRKFDHSKDKTFIDKASQAARTALKLDEQHPHTHVALALINTGQGRFDGAIGEANRAIALDGRNAMAWRELGRAQQGLNRMTEAEQSFLKAVELDPNDWSTFNQLGGVRLMTKRSAEAMVSFRRALDIAPDNSRALNNLGAALHASGKIDDAIATFERSLSISPNATAAQNLGKIYYDRQLYADAARAYSASVSLPGVTVAHWRNLGSAAYWVPGMRDKSKAAYEQAVTLGEQARATNDKDPATVLALADGYAVLSRFTEDSRASGWREKATMAVTDASRLALQDPAHLYTLAGVYEQMGDRDQALAWLQKAVKAGYPTAAIKTSPWMKELRSDPRAAALIGPGR